MDATEPFRNYLEENGLHDFEIQGRGARENGVKIDAYLVSEQEQVKAPASLYKPKAKPTKNGDPRIWFSRLHHHTNPDDILAVTEHDGFLFVVNLTQVDVASVLDAQKNGPLWNLIQAISVEANAISVELLQRLRRLSFAGYLKSVMPGQTSTAVGRTLEDVLGISMNSSKEPDYKGIELKSARSKTSKKQLFSQVPNWKISKFDSMTDVLDAFGYLRQNYGDSLNCTVSASSANPQGLKFEVDKTLGILNETSSDPKYGVFASWYLSDLRKRLEAKHRETFWIHAKSHIIGGHEHFELMSALHTRNPILSQFDLLVEMGDITMDHQMVRLPSGRAHEKGPSFKVKAASLDLLFPPSKTYSLAYSQTLGVRLSLKTIAVVGFGGCALPQPTINLLKLNRFLGFLFALNLAFSSRVLR
jgi:hypothetical protein